MNNISDNEKDHLFAGVIGGLTIALDELQQAASLDDLKARLHIAKLAAETALNANVPEAVTNEQ